MQSIQSHRGLLAARWARGKIFRCASRASSISFSSQPPAYPMDLIDEANISNDSPDQTALQREIADAVRQHHHDRNPLILRGAVSTSPALKTWTSIEYLLKRISSDPWTTGSVEMGGSYNDPNANRMDLPVVEYLQYLQIFAEQYGANGSEDIWEKPPEDTPSDHILYMAQNDFPQSLRDDVIRPEFCGDESYGVGEGKLYSTMWWIGPRGSLSPLHFDPLDNMLMQFVGRKRLILFPPSQAGGVPWHYAGSGGQQRNTSPIDAEHPDVASYPLFGSAPTALYGVLHPGDALFLPSRWWHHVRSLDTAASVNTWFR